MVLFIQQSLIVYFGVHDSRCRRQSVYGKTTLVKSFVKMPVQKFVQFPFLLHLVLLYESVVDSRLARRIDNLLTTLLAFEENR